VHGQILLGTLCRFRITLTHQMIDLTPAVPGKHLKKPHDSVLPLSNSKPLCFCVGTSGEQPCGSTGKSEKSIREIGRCHFICIIPVLLLAFIHENSIVWREMYTSISVTLETGLVAERTPVWDMFIWKLCLCICFKQYSDSGTKIMTVKNNCTQGLSALFQRPSLRLNWMFFNI